MANKRIVTELTLENSQYIAKLKESSAELQKYADNAKKSNTDLLSTFNSLKTGVQVAAGLIAFSTIKSFIQLAGETDTVKTAFSNMTRSMGGDADRLLERMRQVSRGTISDLELMKNASMAMQLMGEEGLKNLPKMIEIAVAAARLKGEEASKMLEDLVTAAGRQSVQVLDNVGISSTKASQYIDQYAASLGKTADKLTDVEKKQAFTNAAMRAGQEIIDVAGKGSATLGEKVQGVDAKFKNLSTNLATIVTPAISKLIDWINAVITPIADLIKWLDTLNSKGTRSLKEISDEAIKLRADIDRWAKMQGVTADEFIRKFKDVKNATGDVVRQYIALGEELKKLQGEQKKTSTELTPSAAPAEKLKDKFKEAEISMSQFYERLGMYQQASIQKTIEDYQVFVSTKQAKQMTEQEYQLAMQEMDNQLLLAQVQGAQREVMLREQVLRAKLGLESQLFTGIEMFAQAGAQLMSSENKTLFKVGQAAAIANVWVNTAQAITKGYAQLGAFGGSAFAALMATVGAVQSANILKQKPPQAAKIEKVMPVTPTLTAQPIAIPLAQGVFDIKDDTFAMLHKGESVMPKSWAQSVREGELSMGGTQIIVQGDVYGYDDFMAKVQTGLLELQRRTGKQIISTRRGD
jgi:hypothetical protein